MVSRQQSLWKEIFEDNRTFLENDLSLGNRTATDTRKAKAQNQEIELPVTNPGFLLDPTHDLQGTPVSEPSAKPKAKSKAKAKAKAKASDVAPKKK